MSEILILIIALVLKLDAMWQEVRLDHYPMDKPTVIEFVDEIDNYYLGGEVIDYQSVAPPKTMGLERPDGSI